MTRECECGSPAERNGVCARCYFLDVGLLAPHPKGRCAGFAEVVSALRGGPQTMISLQGTTGRTRRQLYRTIAKLEETGRVVRGVVSERQNSMERLYQLLEG